LARFRLDYAVLGLSGFDDDGWIMDFDLQKVGVKQAALAAARQGIAVADAGKFERSAIVRVAPPERFARLVSDAAPPAHLAALFRTAGLDL
ncbi:DeoR family transcriptional regulator, partial [Salmonella enterica]